MCDSLSPTIDLNPLENSLKHKLFDCPHHRNCSYFSSKSYDYWDSDSPFTTKIDPKFSSNSLKHKEIYSSRRLCFKENTSWNACHEDNNVVFDRNFSLMFQIKYKLNVCSDHNNDPFKAQCVPLSRNMSFGGFRIFLSDWFIRMPEWIIFSINLLHVPPFHFGSPTHSFFLLEKTREVRKNYFIVRRAVKGGTTTLQSNEGAAYCYFLCLFSDACLSNHFLFLSWILWNLCFFRRNGGGSSGTSRHRQNSNVEADQAAAAIEWFGGRHQLADVSSRSDHPSPSGGAHGDGGAERKWTVRGGGRYILSAWIFWSNKSVNFNAFRNRFWPKRLCFDKSVNFNVFSKNKAILEREFQVHEYF